MCLVCVRAQLCVWLSKGRDRVWCLHRELAYDLVSITNCHLIKNMGGWEFPILLTPDWSV